MECLLVKNSVVDNAALFDSCPTGWEVSPGGVGPGYTKNLDGSFSAPVVVKSTADLAAEARMDRDARLVKADIAINLAIDNALDPTALRAYRQALRDVPAQAGFPTTINWPVMP